MTGTIGSCAKGIFIVQGLAFIAVFFYCTQYKEIAKHTISL